MEDSKHNIKLGYKSPMISANKEVRDLRQFPGPCGPKSSL